MSLLLQVFVDVLPWHPRARMGDPKIGRRLQSAGTGRQVSACYPMNLRAISQTSRHSRVYSELLPSRSCSSIWQSACVEALRECMQEEPREQAGRRRAEEPRGAAAAGGRHPGGCRLCHPAAAEAGPQAGLVTARPIGVWHQQKAWPATAWAPRHDQRQAVLMLLSSSLLSDCCCTLSVHICPC